MIQRIQSVWLLFATLCNAITFRLPFYSGDWAKDDPSRQVVDLKATTTLWLTIFTVIAGLLALVTIFLYDNRKLQLKLVYLGVFLTAVLITMYFLEVANFNSGSVAVWIIFYIAILACYLLAARGIRKDIKLIKDSYSGRLR